MCIVCIDIDFNYTYTGYQGTKKLKNFFFIDTYFKKVSTSSNFFLIEYLTLFYY